MTFLSILQLDLGYSNQLQTNMHRVFVYGTLKRGEPNHHAISEAAGSHHFVDTGRTVTFFPMMVSSQINVPILLAKPGEGKVRLI